MLTDVNLNRPPHTSQSPLKRHIVLPVLALVLALGAACNRDAPEPEPRRPAAPPKAGEAPRPAPRSDRPRVVALGDSLTAGLGLAETEAYPALLQKRIDDEGLPFEVVNAGVSGDTSAGGLRRLDWALAGNPRVLILALGANDGLRGLPVERMRENLASIIGRAQARGIRVVLAGMEAPPNFGPEYTAAFRNAYRSLAKEHEVVFVPFLLDRVAGESRYNQGDGIHPNREGAEILADTIWRAVRPVLKELSATS